MHLEMVVDRIPEFLNTSQVSRDFVGFEQSPFGPYVPLPEIWQSSVASNYVGL